MGIGALSAYRPMPYIYNTNTLSVNSLKPVKAVSNDVSQSHIEQVPEEVRQETTNPLAKGETVGYADVLQSQIQMGMQNAMRLFGDQSVFANAG